MPQRCFAPGLSGISLFTGWPPCRLACRPPGTGLTPGIICNGIGAHPSRISPTTGPAPAASSQCNQNTAALPPVGCARACARPGPGRAYVAWVVRCQRARWRVSFLPFAHDKALQMARVAPGGMNIDPEMLKQVWSRPPHHSCSTAHRAVTQRCNTAEDAATQRSTLQHRAVATPRP